jgi:putative peptidoglycan lipid II flippase
MTGTRAVDGRRLAAGVAGAAVLIGAVTVASRVVGFGRWLVFAEAVGASCLGTAYATANMVPNLVFEVVAGGALAGAVVPLLAAPLARGDRETVRRTASALLTWSLAVLVALAAAAALAAGPVMAALVGDVRGCDRGDTVAAAARMFVVFAPQIALYGVAVVCSGILNAHRRFLAAAAAPLVSSAVVVAAYVAFGVGYDGDRDAPGAVPARWELVLSVGTTAGVLALAATVALPVLGLRAGLRPTLRFPPGVAARARRLALAGVAALVTQQLALVVVIVLANDVGGALNVYTFTWAVFLLPYAVLAVPIATSAFPALSAAAGGADGADGAGFAATVARTTRAVVLACLLGTAVLAGTADPVARTFLDPGEVPGPAEMAGALLAFAPGLLGYGLVAHLGRALYARDAGRAAALATVTGWAVVIGGSVVLTGVAGERWTVAAIGAANSAGMTVAGMLLVAATVRTAGPAAVAGLARAVAAGTAGAAAGALAAATLAGLPEPGGKVVSAALAAGTAAVAAAVFAAVVLVLDGADLRALVRRRFRDA